MMKIMVTGVPGVGKTSLFYGMLSKMMSNRREYKIGLSEGEQTVQHISCLLKLSLPGPDRFPKKSNWKETYSFGFHNSKELLTEVEWVDFNSAYSFDTEVYEADCLFLCLDGGLIQGSMDDLDGVVNQLYNSNGVYDLNRILLNTFNEYGMYPSVCIVITKYDKVSQELRNRQALCSIIEKCFPRLFSGDGYSGRMITICPVSLGKEIQSGGKLETKNVELPFLFAVYIKQLWLLKMMNERACIQEELLNSINKLLDDLKTDLEPLPLYLSGNEEKW